MNVALWAETLSGLLVQSVAISFVHFFTEEPTKGVSTIHRREGLVVGVDENIKNLICVETK